MMKYRALHVALMLAALLSALGLLSACSDPAERRDEFLQTGREHLDRGENQKARVAIQNALKIDPKNARSYALMGENEVALENWRKAFSYYRKAAELDPDLLSAQVALGRLYLMAGQTEQARHQVALVLGKDPGNIDILLVQAALLLRAGSSAEAESILKGILARDPKREEAYVLLADLYQQGGEDKATAAILEQGIARLPKSHVLKLRLAALYMAEKDFAKAERIYVQLAGSEPDNVALQLLELKFYRESAQLDKALTRLHKLTSEYPDNEEYYLAQAQVYLDLKDDKAAEQALRRALAANAGFYKVRLALGDLLAHRGEYDQAALIYTDTEAQDPEHPKALEARTRLARVLYMQKKYPQALAVLDKVLIRNPNDAQARLLRGRIHLSRQEPLKAVNEFRQVINARPDLISAYLLLADAYFMNDDPQIAVDTLKSALDRDPDNQAVLERLSSHYLKNGQWYDAVATLSRLSELRPDDRELRVLIGDTYVRKGDLYNAQREYMKLLDMPEGAALGHAKLGNIFLVRGYYKDAQKEFDKSLDIDPLYLPALVGRVRTYLAQKAPKRAESFLKGKIKDFPDNASLYMLLGQAEAEQGRVKEAEAHFLKAIALSPDWPAPYYSIAGLYLNSGQVDRGIAKFEQTLKENPGSQQIGFILGVLNQQAGHDKQAEKHYQAILAKNPDFHPAANNLAYLYAERPGASDRLDRALALAKRAAEATNDAQFLDTLGWVHFRRGELDQAQEALALALKADQENPAANYHLAAVLAAKQNNYRARQILLNTLNKHKEFPEREAARELLRQVGQ